MSKTGENIIYLNYQTSAAPGTNYGTSSKPDSLIDIIKNKNIIYDTIRLPAQGDKRSKKIDEHL